MMVGQTELLNSIPKSLDDMPHTILFEGIKGSGRHTLAREVCSRLGVELLDLKELGVTNTTINDLLLSPVPHFCMLDLEDVSIREQNVMLKFLEEPLNHCYVILFCENTAQVIPTVLNRCRHWKMLPYTKEQLKSFFDEYIMFNEFSYVNDRILELAETPGDIVNLLNININETLDLLENIIANIGNANLSNILILTDKIKDFNEEKGRVDFDTFLKLFFFVIREKIKDDSNIRLYEVYFKLQNIYKFHRSSYLHLNEKQLYEKFLLDLKLILK